MLLLFKFITAEIAFIFLRERNEILKTRYPPTGELVFMELLCTANSSIVI